MTDATAAVARPGPVSPTAPAFALIVAAALSMALLPAALAMPATIVGGVLGLALLQHGAMGRWPTAREAWIDGAVLLVLGCAREDGLAVWQIPDAYAQVLRLTPLGSGAMVLIYGLAAAAGVVRGRSMSC